MRLPGGLFQSLNSAQIVTFLLEMVKAGLLEDLLTLGDLMLVRKSWLRALRGEFKCVDHFLHADRRLGQLDGTAALA